MRKIFPLLLIAFALSGGGCAERAEMPPAQRAGELDLSRARLVDLTHAYDENTLYWPTAPSRFELEELAFGPAEGGYFYSAYAFCTPEHGGTHVDAPIHFAESGWTLGEVPLDRLVGPAVVIDVEEQAAADPDYRLSRDAVLAWEEEHGSIPSGAMVLLRTGWSRNWPDARSYLGDDTPGDASRLRFPSYGEEAARFLVEDRGVSALGVDTASIDYGPAQDFPVHRIAAARNVIGLENLTRLDEVPPTGAWVFALPIKIARGSGGPARIVAVVPD